ncbi:MAG TPA: S-adenosylmethionine decarboxylase [Bacteroidales bacterium]|nr:S-adenosylmethionine decarboxylase [Bacteroidales bacterium]HPT01122.1 S-adenosylmethionine decarboxylase [Bacteroidales bacterium]
METHALQAREQRQARLNAVRKTFLDHMIKDLAPNITRKRLLLEGFYTIDADKATIKDYFDYITKELNVRTYSDPIIFETGNRGKKENQGFDAFVPLIDSGISCYVWVYMKFISVIIYTCKDFDEKKAVDSTKAFFKIGKVEWNIF